jgi:hypothetical protein
MNHSAPCVMVSIIVLSCRDLLLPCQIADDSN